MTLRRGHAGRGREAARAGARAGARGRRRAGGAFTLVELLVVIGVIGVLIGLLAPAISGARKAGKTAVCLSNMHQIAVAWIAYMGDHKDVFPFRRPNDRYAHHMNDWGGVDWYDERAPSLVRAVYLAERPVNEYVGEGTLRIRTHTPCFQCPSDDGLWYGGVTPFYSDEDVIQFSSAENPGESMYGSSGTSYFANEWIWVKPSARRGWVGGGGFVKANPATSLTNRSTDVRNMSRFVLVGDKAWLQAGRLPKDWRTGAIIQGRRTGWPYAFWHGDERINIARLDGSGAHVKMQESVASCNDYDFWIDPALQGEGSSVMGHFYSPAARAGVR